MNRFVHIQNVAHYRRLLASSNDKLDRPTILKLLAEEAEEEAKDQSQPPK